MKYFCVSDIHGKFKKLIVALNNADFDKEKDTLVVVGDAFDRGADNREVLDFIMDCPHRILIWGNHDLRLMEIAMGDFIADYDIQNGTTQTVRDLAYDYVDKDCRGNVHICAQSLIKNTKLWKYFRECHYAVEFPDIIMTHAWLPVYTLVGEKHPRLFDDWRKTDRYTWSETTWGNTKNILKSPYNVFPEKTLLVGHWWAWDIAELYGEKRSPDSKRYNAQIDCSTFKLDNLAIFIDGCSNYTYGGCVNVYVYESDAEPIFIK